MDARLRSLIYRPSKRVAGALSLAFVMVGCSVDFFTGTAYSPLIFYIPAVIYAGWLASDRVGWICITLIAIVDSINVASVSHIGATEFNAITRISTIALVCWVVCRLRREMRMLEDVNCHLREIDLQKNKLFGVIFHDLRSPFNAVLGYAELLERGTHDRDPDRTRRYSRACRDAARSAYDLLENLLQWAHLQMKRTEFAPAVFETSAMIDRCMQTQRAAAELKNVEVVKGTHRFVPELCRRFSQWRRQFSEI